jgi:Flp pilus assembly pilin Flp
MRLWLRRGKTTKSTGQALIEYALILALVVIAIIAVLTITGPAVGNVFSNQVYNLLGGDLTPYSTLEPDDFWTQVAAVASYTPDSPGLITNTPAPATKTPTPGPTLTPTLVTPSPMPTLTFTPGPSPTPPDRDFGYPFVDPGEHPDWWEYDFDDLIDNPWNAEYWNYSAWLPNMSSMAPSTGVKRETVAELNYYLNSGVAPSSGVSENYYARYTTTVTLEAKSYMFRIKRNNGIRIWVDSQIVVDANVPNAGDPITWTQWATDPYRNVWFDRKFMASAGSHTVTVEFVDDSSDAELRVFLTDTGLVDTGDCKWALSDEQSYSPTTAWSDSPGQASVPNAYCILALRGTIDLTGALDPKLQFYDRYDLRSGTKTLVGVSVAGTNQWVENQVHYQTSDLTWARQTFDLRNFGGQDFRGQVIEVRFVIDTLSSATTNDGWWIDDIRVEEEVRRRYTVGFVDDMESTSHWYPSGTWARTNESAHSGSTAWSDSPGANYTHGTNSTLELDGTVDLTDPRSVEPEVVLWHRYNLNYGDAIYAEISTNNRASWTQLTGTYLAYQSSDSGWSQLVIPLTSYDGQEFYFRFRLDARSDSRVGDGWWIDDFELRNRPSAVIYPDWCDSMEGGGSSWVAEGTWGVVSGTDNNTSQSYNPMIFAHSGSSFWSDSPGANYTHNTDSSLMLGSKVDLNGTTNPELAFWHQWDLAYSDNVHVEVSTNGGTTWTSIWKYMFNGTPPGYGSTVNDGGYNHVLSWTRESISLKPYVNQRINVRFRIEAMYDASVDNGWFLDDICFQESTQTVRVPPLIDTLEAGASNWYAGGTWSISPENTHTKLTGNRAFSDSPGTSYNHEANSILELKHIINLAGTVEPTLYYWEAFNMSYQDYALLEVRVSNDGGTTWGGWTEINAARRQNTTTLSWDRRQVNLASYIPGGANPNRVIKLRYRLYAANSSNVGDGWWLDEISIVDRNGAEPEFRLPFYEDVDSTNNYWVFDGTWDRIPMFRMVGSGNGLGPGAWTGKYYADTNANRAFNTGEYRFTYPNLEEINFNWGTGRPGLPIGSTETPLPSSDNYMARWTRTISVSDTIQYTIRTYSDDGIRVIVDPPGDPDTTPGYATSWTWNINAWYDRGYSSTPDEATVTLTPGFHTFLVEYYEGGGDARVRVDFGKWGQVFHDSPNAGATKLSYIHLSDMSTTLEGTIDLTGTTTAALTYWDTRELGWGDSIRVEISTDEGFTWTSIRNTGGTDTNWRKRLHDLSGYAGQRINIRFRLDARSDPNVNDGWYIDDIVVAE